MNCIKKMQWSLISNKWWRWSVSCLRWLSVCLPVTVSPYQLVRLIFYILTLPFDFLYTSKYSQCFRRINCSIAKCFYQCSAQQRTFYSFILNLISNEVSVAWYDTETAFSVPVHRKGLLFFSAHYQRQ